VTSQRKFCAIFLAFSLVPFVEVEKSGT